MSRKRTPVKSEKPIPEVEEEMFGETDEPELMEKAEEEKPAPMEEPAPEPEPVEEQPVPETPVEKQLPMVSVEVFSQVCGRKPDQMAGFVRWVKRGKMPARTIPEWKEALTSYENRPV